MKKSRKKNSSNRRFFRSGCLGGGRLSAGYFLEISTDQHKRRLRAARMTGLTQLSSHQNTSKSLNFKK